MCEIPDCESIREPELNKHFLHGDYMRLGISLLVAGFVSSYSFAVNAGEFITPSGHPRGTVASVQATLSFEAHTYVSRCRFNHPLHSYQGCTASTSAGQSAEECAINEARVKCRLEFNSDCMHVGTSYITVSSRDFPGYRGCEAQVYYRGYRIATGN